MGGREDMPFSEEFIEVLYRIPVLLVSFTVHELSHAYVSYRQGDPTPKLAGRITLNPIKHIDPIGAIMLLVARFGWAKPVPIDPSYYKNRKAGIMLTSFAGPLSNIVLAAICTAFFALFVDLFSGHSLKELFEAMNYVIGEDTFGNNLMSLSGVLYFLTMGGFTGVYLTTVQTVALTLLLNFISINILLAAFNLVPIPPLDGSKILFSILPERIYYRYILPYERYGMFLIMALSFTGVLSFILTPFFNVVQTIIISIITVF